MENEATNETEETKEVETEDKEPMVPQSKVNSLIAAEKQKWKSRLAELEKKETQTKPQPEGDDDVKSEIAKLRAEIEAEKSRATFSDTLAGTGLKLEKKQKEKLRKLYDAEKPDDPEEWIQETVELFGFAKEEKKEAEVKPDPTTPPASNSMKSLERKEIHPDDLTPEQVQILREQGKLKEYVRSFPRS